MANLRGFLIDGGGTVEGSTALTGKPYSATLTLDPITLRQLKQKHGLQLENWWRETFGYALDCLTESEARYLLRAESFDTIRTRILAARS